MNAKRFAKPAIAERNGMPVLARKSGELVFHDEVGTARFRNCREPAEQGLVDWNDSQPQLVKAIASAAGNDQLNPSRGYYESWLAALESVLAEKRLLPDG